MSNDIEHRVSYLETQTKAHDARHEAAEARLTVMEAGFKHMVGVVMETQRRLDRVIETQDDLRGQLTIGFHAVADVHKKMDAKLDELVEALRQEAAARVAPK